MFSTSAFRCILRIAAAFLQADADPSQGVASLFARLEQLGGEPADGPRHPVGSRDVRASAGDLRTCIELATDVLERGSSDAAVHAVNLISIAGLLARDDAVLRLALDRSRAMERRNPGVRVVAHHLQHRLDELDGGASTVDHSLMTTDVVWPMTNATLWVAAS